MPRTPSWLQSLIEEHIEEFQMLWEIRLQVVRDSDYTAEDLRELDERIAAHLDGIVLSHEHALPLLLEGLASGERGQIFVAATAMLTLQSNEGLAAMWRALDEAEGEALDGFMDAFCCTMPDLWEQKLQSRLTHSSKAVAMVAAYCLAHAGRLSSTHPIIVQLLFDENPTVRRRGWEVVGLTSCGT